MTARRPRRLRPQFERLEAHLLLSAAVPHRPAHGHHRLHVQTTSVDLRKTPVGDDIRRVLYNSTPKLARKSFALYSLKLDDQGRLLGTASATYRAPFVGTIDVLIRFNTPADGPQPSDINVSASRFNTFMRDKDKVRIATDLATALRRDQAEIAAYRPHA